MARIGLQSSRVSPSMTASDLERSIKFYVDGLGF